MGSGCAVLTGMVTEVQAQRLPTPICPWHLIIIIPAQGTTQHCNLPAGFILVLWKLVPITEAALMSAVCTGGPAEGLGEGREQGGGQNICSSAQLSIKLKIKRAKVPSLGPHSDRVERVNLEPPTPMMKKA